MKQHYKDQHLNILWVDNDVAWNKHIWFLPFIVTGLQDSYNEGEVFYIHNAGLKSNCRSSRRNKTIVNLIWALAIELINVLQGWGLQQKAETNL